MLKILNRYNNKKLSYGEYDCNLIMLEIFEKEIYDKIVNRYDTVLTGTRLAKKESGYYTINSLITDKDCYQITDKNLVNSGCFFVRGLHVSICIGTKTMALVNGKFKLVPTSLFLNNQDQIMYKKNKEK